MAPLGDHRRARLPQVPWASRHGEPQILSDGPLCRSPWASRHARTPRRDERQQEPLIAGVHTSCDCRRHVRERGPSGSVAEDCRSNARRVCSTRVARSVVTSVLIRVPRPADPDTRRRSPVADRPSPSVRTRVSVPTCVPVIRPSRPVRRACPTSDRRVRVRCACPSDPYARRASRSRSEVYAAERFGRVDQSARGQKRLDLQLTDHAAVRLL